MNKGKLIVACIILGLMIEPIPVYGKTEIVTPKVVFETKAEEIKMGFLTYEERELIAKIVMAEAEGEEENGKRLVIDTILNRVDHESFPNSVEEVIFQKGQFTPTTNGRLKRCYVDNDILQLVMEEELIRMNDDVLFFQPGGYSSYGEPVFQVGNHYFSTLEA